MKKIVSKTAAKTKGKAIVYKCEYCDRKLCSLNAIESHHRNQHNLQPFRVNFNMPYKKLKREVKGIVNKSEVKKIVTKAPVIQSTTSTRRTSYVSNSPNTVFEARYTPAKQTASTKAHNTPAKQTASITKAHNTPAKQIAPTKVEYQCPRCFLSFNSHMIAVQHIQKFHYSDRSIPMNVQPERKEWCWKCKKKVGSLPIHVCGADKVEDPIDVIYCCLGCNKRLNNLRLFYSHVVSSHASLETLFFPTNKELSRWVQDVEYKTNARYSDFVKFDNKCYAHCTQATKKISSTVTNICPSIIMVHEFPKGLQVHHYGHHKQHTFRFYELTDKFKKYSITSFLKVSDSYYQLKDLKSDDNDLYLQFKQLMESVVVDAAKLKSEALTVLFGKALEMTSLLTQYDNDDDMSDDSTKPEKRSMTASDIEKALQEPSILDEMSIEPHIKKMKTNLETPAPAPMILNSFSLADAPEDATKENSATDNLVKSNIKIKDLGSLQEPKLLNKNTETPKAKILDSTPSSFSESFEVFVEKNFSGGEKGGDEPIRRSVRSTRPARNRIEEQPTLLQNVDPDTPQNNNRNLIRQNARRSNTDNSLKPDVPVQPAPTPMVKIHSFPTMEIKQKTNSDTVDVLEKLKSSSNISIGVNKTPKTKTDIKSIPDDSKHLPTSKNVPDKPKTVAALKSKRVIKPKKDIKYEVKEREDDCNILILKI